MFGVSLNFKLTSDILSPGHQENRWSGVFSITRGARSWRAFDLVAAPIINPPYTSRLHRASTSCEIDLRPLRIKIPILCINFLVDICSMFMYTIVREGKEVTKR